MRGRTLSWRIWPSGRTFQDGRMIRTGATSSRSITPPRHTSRMRTSKKTREVPTGVYEHGATEFLHVISGELLIRADGLDYRLAAGDSIYLQSAVPNLHVQRGSALTMVGTTAAPAGSVRADR